MGRRRGDRECGRCSFDSFIMKKRKNVTVRRPTQYCVLPMVLAILNAAISSILYAMSKSLRGAVAMATPILIFGYLFAYQSAWRVELHDSEITVRTLFRRRMYIFSQITDVNERFSAAYRAVRLELVFYDGKYVDICDNYRNYLQFRKYVCSKCSIRKQ